MSYDFQTFHQYTILFCYVKRISFEIVSIILVLIPKITVHVSALRIYRWRISVFLCGSEITSLIYGATKTFVWLFISERFLVKVSVFPTFHNSSIISDLD